MPAYIRFRAATYITRHIMFTFWICCNYAGNAATPRNNNSSRFGKFIELQFTRYVPEGFLSFLFLFPTWFNSIWSYLQAEIFIKKSFSTNFVYFHGWLLLNGIVLYLKRTGHMKGGTIQTYLLEKTRLVHQGSGENNFHVFYQVVVSACLIKNSFMV